MKMKNNFVAKHARAYNKAKVFIDRKVASKKGYSKYKGYQEMDESCPNCEELADYENQNFRTIK